MLSQLDLRSLQALANTCRAARQAVHLDLDVLQLLVQVSRCSADKRNVHQGCSDT